MEQKHTPLPWHIDTAPVSGKLCIISKEAWVCGQLKNQPKDFKEGEANAEFIVRACNSHYDLIEALERARKHVKELVAQPSWEKDLWFLDQALAKAKVKS